MLVRTVTSLRAVALEEGLTCRSVWVKTKPELAAKEVVKCEVPPGLVSFYIRL